MVTYSNSELMDRYGFRICSSCNADMPADQFVGTRCHYCAAEEERGDPSPPDPSEHSRQVTYGLAERALTYRESLVNILDALGGRS